MKTSLKIKLVFVLVMTFFFIIGLAFGLVIDDKKNEQICSQNPLVYGVQTLERINNANFTCSCYSTDSDLKPFYFNDKEISNENPLNYP